MKLRDFLTTEQAGQCFDIWEAVKGDRVQAGNRIMDEVIRPNLDEMNQKILACTGRYKSASEVTYAILRGLEEPEILRSQ